MRNKQTPSKQASKQAKIIAPFLPAHTLSARHIPLFPPLKPAFSSGRVSARLLSLFSFPRHACAPLPHRAALLRPDGIVPPSGFLF
ncbi:hypothetical protein C7T62_05045 [Neisseria gonorrhoeae]